MTNLHDYCMLHNPQLLSQWDMERNTVLCPDTVSIGSGKKAWWKCAQGHRWTATVASRVKGSGCPYCSGKKAIAGENDLATVNPDLAKQWHPTRNGELTPRNVKARSHNMVWWLCENGHVWKASVDNRSCGHNCPYCSGRRVLQGFNDLATVKPHLAKEWLHEKNKSLAPEQVTAGSNKVVWWRCAKGHEWAAQIKQRSDGTGCPYCSGRRVVKGETDLLTLSPALAIQWHPTKNDGLTPSDVSVMSGKKVWWRCEHDHEWQAGISDRTKGNGCPYCSGKRVTKGASDLATVNPDLAKQWNYERNGALTPWSVTAVSGKKVWWQCEKSHEWQASISNRAKGRGCPFCAGKKILKGFNDLASVNPELAKQWHPDKNHALQPDGVTISSGKKVWWQCEKSHEWQAVVASRTNGIGCPICSGKKVLKGYNDLRTAHQKLADQWHPTKNGDLTPERVTKGSGKKVWWQCEKGHEWQAVIASRSAGCGCPFCAPNTSFAEQAAYYYIKQIYKAENKYRFMRKEIDIYLPRWQIGIEHDGPLHLLKEVQEADARKDALLKKNNIHLIRVKDTFPFSVDEAKATIYYTYNENDYSDLERAVRETLRLLAAKTGKRCDISIDITRDQTVIRDQYKNYETENAIFTKSKEAERYWDWDKNGRLNPLYVTYGSGKIIHWKCGHGHEWKSTAAGFVAGGRCPICSGRQVLAGFNDLKTVNPSLAKEWHPWRNGDLKPTDVTVSAGKVVWWQCEEGHEWCARVADRPRTGCPYCSGKRVLQGYNDLATVRPELAEQWHPSKNGDLTARGITAGSGKQIWWICKQGHEWRTTVASRSAGCGCPYCAGKKAIRGVSDLATVNSELAAQWHPTKNGSLTARDVTANSRQKIWWRCELGHEWQTLVSYRSRGNGCPYCSGRQAIKGETDLETVYPKLAEQWHPTQNGILKPDGVTPMSDKKVWWKCENGHSWKAAISNRTSGSGCPYCSGRLAIKGYNDLSTVNPNLCKEWNYARNRDISPHDVTKWSNKKVWWVCGKGHEWRTNINSRTNGYGCPICAGKQVLKGYNDLAATKPELAKEWHPTKNNALTPQMVTSGSGKKVWWQCNKGHEWQAEIANRSAGCGCPVCSGNKVLPGYNDFASAHTEAAKEWHTRRNGGLLPQNVTVKSKQKVWWICRYGHEWLASIGDRSRGYGCPYCSGRRAIAGRNDLATVSPALAQEWHPEKNGSLTPSEVKPHSNLKVWWLCRNGHEWKAAINSRTAGNGCAYCSGRRVLEGVTDLATVNPKLAEEWNLAKNKELTPRDVTKGSEKKVWWTCKKGHEWKASIDSRARGSGCPVCAGKKILIGFNDLATANPSLAKEWHFTKNGDLKPYDVTKGSGKKVWWLCEKGHDWQAIISNRAKGAGCPVCAKERKSRKRTSGAMVV